MSLLPFVLVTTVGAVLALLLRRNERVATTIAVVSQQSVPHESNGTVL